MAESWSLEDRATEGARQNMIISCPIEEYKQSLFVFDSDIPLN